MDQLILRLPHDGPAGWWLSSAPTRIVYGPLSEAAHAAVGCRVTVLAPAGAVTLLTARIPTRQRQRLQQALPYALEEQLAADVETLHFAPAAVRGDTLPCAVVDRVLLREWLAELDAAGLRPDRLLPDVLALPWVPGTWSVLVGDEGVRLRTAEMAGLASDAEALPHLLPLLLGQAGEQRPTRLHFYEAQGAGHLQPLLQSWCEQAGIGYEHTPLAGDSLTLLAPVAARGEGINLLQGEFSRREQTRQLWRPWRAAAALLAALLLLQGGMTAARYAVLAREEARLAGAIDDVYRATFPEAQRVVDARAQMEQKLVELRRGSAGQEFHRMLLHAAPALHNAGVELRALNYSTGLLDIEVSAGDLQALDRLKQALDNGSLRAEITGADSSGGAVAGRITLRGGGA